jgi:aspartate aminotransferase
MSISEMVRKGFQRDSLKEKLVRDREVFVLRYGADQVFDLTADYPALEPPAPFNQEMQKLIAVPRAGLHRYMENAGFTATRTAIAGQLKQLSGLDFTLAEVIMTSGASGALNMAIKAVLNPHEEIILFSPLAYDYPAYVANHGGVARLVPCRADRQADRQTDWQPDWQPDLSAFENSLTPETKLVILNSPNDPSGVVYSAETLQQIAEIITRRSAAFKTRIYVVSDDSYRKFYYGPPPCPWILTYYPHTIIINSYSKELSIPGERIGFTAVSPRCEEAKVVVGGLIHANRTLGFVNAPALMQNSLTNLPDQSPEIATYRARRDFLYSNLLAMGYQAVKPQGGFFLLVKSPVKDDAAFVEELLKEHILTLPGSLFMAPGYIRISYCVAPAVLEGALPGFKKALAAGR